MVVIITYLPVCGASRSRGNSLAARLCKEINIKLSSKYEIKAYSDLLQGSPGPRFITVLLSLRKCINTKQTKRNVPVHARRGPDRKTSTQPQYLTAYPRPGNYKRWKRYREERWINDINESLFAIADDPDSQRRKIGKWRILDHIINKKQKETTHRSTGLKVTHTTLSDRSMYLPRALFILRL